STPVCFSTRPRVRHSAALRRPDELARITRRGPLEMTSANPPAAFGAARPRLRDCPASVRELRARERALYGLHRLDRTLHAFWARLPLRAFRVAGTAAFVGVGAYLVV